MTVMEFLDSKNLFMGLVLGTLLSFTMSIVLTRYMRGKLPIAHSVAIIGLPRSGKTTLITSIFSEIFSQKITNYDLTLRGEETINRVNGDIAKLESGEELNPTTDQDLFSYRAELLTGGRLFGKRYKVEIGDFPGENSDSFVSTDVKWIQNIPYFKWVMDADSFVFIVDVSKAIDPKEASKYRADLTSSYRAAWQRLKDHHLGGTKNLRDKPITVVFTKSDLVIDSVYSFGSDKVSETAIARKLDPIVKQYSDLIHFFRSETTKCNVVYSSSFVRSSSDNVKLGVKSILGSILP
ncbi:GTPase domain-containing protein [Vibrio alginolyticus]|uniref:GTPase domain-containing protein n=1 Tax=Vibrio alginolyticus TaxID=663 RepID=UPI00215CAD72|nr:GTPase domain-containing protein [Vibrio alginolyticus]MCR9543283.1 GTPase domain-containing protein [Vibrio alginolyticus]